MDFYNCFSYNWCWAGSGKKHGIGLAFCQWIFFFDPICKIKIHEKVSCNNLIMKFNIKSLLKQKMVHTKYRLCYNMIGSSFLENVVGIYYI